MNIRDITPCIDCLRNCHPITPDADGARKAGAYLLATALEASDSEVPLPSEMQEDIDDITNASRIRGITARALGMISVCGEKIGTNNCTDWQLDTERMTIQSQR